MTISNRNQRKSTSPRPVRENNAKHHFFERTLYIASNLIVSYSKKSNKKKIKRKFKNDKKIQKKGQYVDVQVSDGSWYQGYFYTINTKKGLGVVLRFARKKSENKAVGEILEKKIIHAHEFVQVLAKDVTFVEDMPSSAFTITGFFFFIFFIFIFQFFKIGKKEGFMTDTAISRASDIKERELQPWRPDETVPAPNL